MMGASRAGKLAVALLGPLLGASACNPSVAVPVARFESTQSLGDGIRGKSWRAASYLEVDPANPTPDGSNRTHASFDAVVAGSGQAWVMASLYDGASLPARYKGYARLYSEGTGWASAGSDFRAVATESSAADLGAVGAAAGPAGLVLGHFHVAASADSVTAHRSGSWQPDAQSSGTGNASIAATSDLSIAPLIVSVFDTLGRGFSFYNYDAAAVIQVDQWAQATGVSSALNWGASTYRQISAKFDGKRYACAVYQVPNGGNPDVNARCLDTVTMLDALQTLSTGSDLLGNALATDGSGTLVAVFLESAAGTPQLVSRTATDGTWDVAGSPTVVSSGMAPGFQAAAQGQPGVAYLGSGRFIAAWVAVNPTTLVTRLYSSLYDGSSWGAPVQIGSDWSYTTRPRVESFSLFSNGDDNAGIAVNFVSSEGASQALDTRVLLVSRYHRLTGWQSFTQRGNGCRPGAAAMLAGCTHRPVGVILPSGVSLVVFQDQDSSGYFRIAGVEFR